MKKKVWAILPARFGSTRFPGKPLVKIRGHELISWVIQGAKQAKLIDEVIVATDHEQIAEVARKAGAKAVMTASDLASGTDRIAAAVGHERVDVVLNVQGDEPLVTGALIDSLVQPMLQDANLEMATLAHAISPEELANPNCVKVILNQNNDAIYFSRYPIPYSRESAGAQPKLALRHIGMYAFQADFLRKFCAQSPTGLELAESLEQLRALQMGARIRVIPTQEKLWGVDAPTDVQVIEKLMDERGIAYGR